MTWQVGWWISLKNGAAGQIKSLAAPGKPGVVIQIDKDGTLLTTMKTQIQERINPYNYSAPRPIKSIKREADLDRSGYGDHPADIMPW